MEEKYCERCGLYLGVVRPARRYCKECAILVQKEKQTERRAPYGVVPCEWCKRPMRKLYKYQKYHKKCANAVRKKRPQTGGRNTQTTSEFLPMNLSRKEIQQKKSQSTALNR